MEAGERPRSTPSALAPERAGIVSRAVSILRAVIGAPDYARYLAHVRAKHPEKTPLSREAFARERERARYEGTGSRCC